MTVPTAPTSVAVLGLGPMGAALARALLDAGHPTTVWNRSPERAAPLAADGASVAADPAAAVRTAELVMVCLRDHPAAREVLGTVPPDAFDGRTVVHLSSSTPLVARETRHLGRRPRHCLPLRRDPGAHAAGRGLPQRSSCTPATERCSTGTPMC